MANYYDLGGLREMDKKNTRKNRKDLIAMGFVCLFLCGVTVWFFLNIFPVGLNEQQDFPLEPIHVNPKWENVSEYRNMERPIPWLVVNKDKPEIPISYEKLTCLYDQGRIIEVKYVIEKNHIKLYGLEEVIGKNGSYFHHRTLILRPESNPGLLFEITDKYIENESIIFIETNFYIVLGKKLIIIFNVTSLALSIFTFALFLRMLFDKNYEVKKHW